MGIKHKSTVKNMPSQFIVEGLIFTSRSGYDSLKNIDNNADTFVSAIKTGSIDIKEFFGRFDKTKVKETHVDAAEYLEFLFPNIAKLRCLYDPDYFKTELDFSANFYSLIDIEFFDD